MHVFLGGIFAAPIAFVGYSFGNAVAYPAARTIDRLMLLPMLAASVAMVVSLALLPPVRATEIGVARRLLELDLPDPVAEPTPSTRLLGAAWLGIVTAIGAVAVGGLFVLVPMGLNFIYFPFSGADQLLLPTATEGTHLTSGWASGWLVPTGLLLIVISLGLLALGARLSVVWAPHLLGPTEADFAALEIGAAEDAARSNTLARELHKSVGQALTAMTIQASAARVLLTSDPARAVDSLQAIERTGRSAVAELDNVLAAIRSGGPIEPAVPESLADVLTAARRSLALEVTVSVDLAELPEPVAAVLCRVAREGLDNAVRYGAGSAALTIGRRDECLVVDLTNPVVEGVCDESTAAGRGLQDISHEVESLGGRLETEHEERTWRLTARVPVGGKE